MITIVKAVKTCSSCPAQWDAWTDTGQYLYLRYRFGAGTVDDYPDNQSGTWTQPPTGRIAQFDTGRELHGWMTIDEFCARAGLGLRLDRCPAVTWLSTHYTEHGGRSLYCKLPAGHDGPHEDEDGDWTDD